MMALSTYTARWSWLALLFVWGCGQNAENPGVTEREVQQRVTVETVQPVLANFTKQMTVVGMVEPMQQVDLLPLESGFVSEVLVDEGDEVSKGEVLLRLENPMLSRERTALQVEFDVAAEDLERLKQARAGAPGLISASDLANAEAAHARAAANLAATEDRLGFLEIKAPFDGIIASRYAHPGAVVENGLTSPGQTPLLSLVQCKSVRIRLPFPERDLPFIQKGDSVELHFPDLDVTEVAKITRIAAQVDASGHTVDAIVDWRQNRCLYKPGIYVEGTVHGRALKDMLSIPVGVRFERDGLPMAWIVVQGRVEEIPLKVLAEDKSRLALGGVNAQTHFISAGRGLVSVGDAVSTKAAQ